MDKQEPQELAKHRVCVSFEFDVVCNTSPILSSSNDDETKAHDLALLKSFLTADNEKLLIMLVDRIACEMGMNSVETFLWRFLPEINTKCRQLFSKAIDALSGNERRYWQEAATPSDLDGLFEDYLEECTEELFECFSAQFVGSSYQVVKESKTHG